MVADSTATVMVEASKIVLGDKVTEFTNGFFYSLGKWIYLIDALDDYDKDVKKGNFNVFYNAYKMPDFESLIKNNMNDLSFVFNGIFLKIAENFKQIKTYYNTDLINNIVTRGIPATTTKILTKLQNKKGK